LLDDTYNSSPESAIAALDLLADLDGRRIAVLGDMLELGEQELEGHRRVGQHVAQRALLLVTVGELGARIGQEALDCGMTPSQVVAVPGNREAVAYLQAVLQEGDVVLIKGSRGMAMEEIVQDLVCPVSNA
jgi:UDP-N-acetylmuramoyl-tripeptide--D-alanyl-D-alanine ligase